jgi:hypothetical protein
VSIIKKRFTRRNLAFDFCSFKGLVESSFKCK